MYSDSAFWMSDTVYRALLSWYTSFSLDSELDAYAHFLPCLGINMRKYPRERFTDYRKEIFPILENFEFKVIVLKESKFYHLGTMQEYLDNFTTSKTFLEELSIERDTSNYSLCSLEKEKRIHRTVESQPSIVFSYLSEQDQITWVDTSCCSVIEWCFIALPLRIPSKVILSNCVLKRSDGVEYNQNPVSILGGFLYHTVPITENWEQRGASYVTVAFEIEADLKQKHNDAYSVSVAGVSLDRVMKEGNLDENLVLAEGKPYSLWSLKLFREADTAEESFWKTHHFINCILHWKDGTPMKTNIDFSNKELKLFSMKDISRLRNFEVFLKDRKELFNMLKL